MPASCTPSHREPSRRPRVVQFRPGAVWPFLYHNPGFGSVLLAIVAVIAASVITPLANAAASLISHPEPSAVCHTTNPAARPDPLQAALQRRDQPYCSSSSIAATP